MLRKTITIDLDFLGNLALRMPRRLQRRLIRKRFKAYLKKYKMRWVRVIQAFEAIGLGPIDVEVRYSRKGVHVYIRLRKSISVHSGLAYGVRGALGDDPGRISWDILRLVRGMKTGMLMFSIKKGKVHEEPGPDLTKFLKRYLGLDV